MRYEINKILSCKALFISLAVAFLIGMLFSYNAYVKGKTVNSKYEQCAGAYSEEKYLILQKQLEQLQNAYDKSQDEKILAELFEYLDLFEDADTCKNIIEYREKVASDSSNLAKTSYGYYKKLNKTINKMYSKTPELTIGKSNVLKGISDVFCVSEIVDIAFIIVLILFSVFLFLNEHKCNTFIMVKSSVKGGSVTYWNKIAAAFLFTVMVSVIQTLSMTLPTLLIGGTEQWKCVFLLDELFIHSPYILNVSEMVVVITALRTIGYLVLMSCFLCVSLLFNKNILPIAINTFIGLGGFAANYVLSGKYFAISGGVIREAASYTFFRKYTAFPLISEGINYLREYEPINMLGYPVSIVNIAILANVMVVVLLAITGGFIYDINFRNRGA